MYAQFHTECFMYRYSKQGGPEILLNCCIVLCTVVPVKSKMEISLNCVAFSEYMNFNGGK